MQECAETSTGNVIISPFSVFNALCLLSEGAGGETYRQLSTGLGIASNKKLTAAQFKHYYKLLHKAVGGATFELANDIYVQQGYKLNQTFRSTAVNQFKSGIRLLNFADAAESAQIINEKVEKVTNDKIKDLISPDSLGQDTRLVLVNAIYFKGDWLHPFDVENTYRGEFNTANGKPASVEFMNMVNRFNYGNIDDLDATAQFEFAICQFEFIICYSLTK